MILKSIIKRVINRPIDIFIGIVPIFTWFYLTPQISTMEEIQLNWVMYIYLRNCMLISLLAGGLYLYLYKLKIQKNNFKFNKLWLDKNQSKFLFNDQVYHNILITLLWSCPIWTIYECISYILVYILV